MNKNDRGTASTGPGPVRRGFDSLRESAQPDEADDTLDTIDPDRETRMARRGSSRPSAVKALIAAAFRAAVSHQIVRRLQGAKALAVVVVVPTPAWVAPFDRWFTTKFDGRWTTVAREKVLRPSQDSEGPMEVAARLTDGQCVVGIAPDPVILPANLVAAADITIQIASPGPEVVRAAIAAFTGRTPKDVPATMVAGLDLADIVGAMRPGSGPRRIVQRLELAATRSVSATVAGDDVPNLDDAIEFGRAREWGLGLANMISLYRQRLIPLKDLPRGVVLHGPPGTGKSLFSRVLAKKCNLPLFTTSVAEWFANRGTYDDVIRSFGSVMDQAIAQRQAIVFIDEIDSLPNRYALSGSRNSDYWKPLCNYVLTRLDNSISSTRSGVIVIGATNDVAALDPALLRPGRLETAIELGLPDLAGTMNIIRFHAPELKESELERIGAMAEHRTGAELMYLVREGRRLARDAGRGLEAEDLLHAIVPPLAIGPATLRRIAVHEAGHAAAALAQGHDVRSCSVGMRDGRGGLTVIEAADDAAVTRREIEDRAVGLLAGRAAERAIVGTASAGALTDLEQASRMLATMHAAAGLGGTLAYVASPDRALDRATSDPRLQDRLERDLRRLQRRADRLVARHRGAVEAIALALADRRHLTSEEVGTLFESARRG